MFHLIPWKKKEESRELVPQRGHPLAELRHEFDALFDRFLGRWDEPFTWDLDLGHSWGLDVEENDQEVVVKAEVPGFSPDELDVQVSGNLLTVQAEQKGESKGKRKGGNGHYEERHYRTFRRCVTLPPGTDPDRIEARYRNGLLEVHVPRNEAARGKRIPIKA